MATSTDKLAPRIIVNEHDIFSNTKKPKVQPITLIFGFSPIGRTCEMVECNDSSEIMREFGFPVSAAEKYFIDAGRRVVEHGATALMTRLPYDNDQSHKVKYIDYKLGKPISMRDIATVPAQSKMRKKDNEAVTILSEMHGLDSSMTQVQRISQVVGEDGSMIRSMTNDELVELELDPQENLEANTFRIVDIIGQQYGVGASQKQYTGIFPIIVTAPIALYYQGKIRNSTHLDKTFNILKMDEGIEMSTSWFKRADPVDEDTKLNQSEIVASIKQEINFDYARNKYHRNNSFADECAKRFPSINYLERNKLEKKHLSDIGVLVCHIGWDEDQQKTVLNILESFVGRLGRSKDGVDRKINEGSRYIRMYKNIKVPAETDFFVVNDQKIASLGMAADECEKYINFKTSIIDPITYMLESVYSDVDSIHIDTILDAGLSAIAFAAYTAVSGDGETFKTNENVRTKIDWTKTTYDVDEQIETYAEVWSQLTTLFGDFIKSTRGDCVYLADGPRITNLMKNYPIRNYTDLENTEMFHKYLPLFNGYSNNYVARYWNWVYIEDMQYENRGFWVPPSVVMGSQLVSNDRGGYVWLAPAGQQRGIIPRAYDVSVKTKQYNDENDLLYQNHWNFFNTYQNEGIVVEGQKTMQTQKTALDRLNVRRMVCWIKQQVRMIANRYKYEPNTLSMRESFKKDILALLQKVRNGSGISDYLVRCDGSNNNQITIDRHELHCKIAIKPIKAIEYIVIDIDILNGKVGVGNENTVVQK